MYRSIIERLTAGRHDGTLGDDALHADPVARQTARAALALRKTVKPTPSTRSLREDIELHESQVLEQDASPQHLRAYREALGMYRYAMRHPQKHTPQALRTLKAAVTNARAAALADGWRHFPWGRRFVAEAREALARRLAENGRASREVFTGTLLARAADAVETSPGVPTGEPPGDDPPGTFTRRALVTLLPLVERLTTTLTLAPGAPSRAVCV